MSTDIDDGGRDNLSCKVISKYFTSEAGMDESLSDFQEKKITYKEPKKKKSSKSSTSRKDKKIKGQSDIRTLVKSRKNELLTYTKDFDQACKNSGLDVDSEQLQIAIALSKSLQDSGPSQEEVDDDIKPLTARERTRKIKSTLLEYGFKVPNGVIQKKKKRITNKNSKLLNTSESDKRKIINKKYLEILKGNPSSPVFVSIECDHSNKEVYHKTTNIPYSQIKAVDAFYVPNLIEKTTHKTCLLRDWSEIPGRPLSPDVEVNNFQFDEFSFSQLELDCLLSHPFQEIQEIIKSKNMKNCEKVDLVNIETQIDMNLESESKIDNKVMCDKRDTECIEKNISTTQADRSQSPDLFDEDDYTTTICVKDPINFSEIKSSTGSDKTSLMDLTECVGNMNNIQKTIIMHSTKQLVFRSSNISEESDIEADPFTLVRLNKDDTESEALTQNKRFQIVSQSEIFCSETVREINDFMEVTDCVGSELNHNVNNENKISQKSICLEETVDVDLSEDQTAKVNKEMQSQFEFMSSNIVDVNTENIENVDLTQASGTIISFKEKENQVPCFMDLTQSSNSNEDFPLVKLSSKNEESLDATIILNDNDINCDVFREDNHIPNNDKSLETLPLADEEHVTNIQDNTTTSSKNNSCIANEENDEVCPVVFEDNENTDFLDNNISRDKESSMSTINDYSEIVSDDKIDLTQSPELQSINEDKIDLAQSPQSPNNTHSIESLGKQNNISIDYDELYDNMTTSPDVIRYQGDPIKDNEDSIIEIVEHDDDQSAIIHNMNESKVHSHIEPSQSIDVNREFDTTNNISEHMENVITYSANTNSTYLPSVEIKKNNEKNKIATKTKHAELSPIKILDVNNKSFRTPVNGQYIIKTDNVTPMLDYESMSTPARNKELEKYGIKPFKRKRAIQLLKYIYNQTHPVVEDCAIDDMPSTSKKAKLDDQETEQIPVNKNQKSPRKLEERDADKENNLYVETKFNPDVKRIECCPEDWVFQTREKAKVHSCRVPLHIAFHNYVSCRHLLRAAILRYEPVNIDIIHKDLIATGYRYNPKELLKFLDKKCITVKTAENNARNRKLNKS